MENFVKKSSRLELLAQFESNFVEWSLGGPLTELYPMTLPSNHDGRKSQTLFNIGPYGKLIRKSSHLELVTLLELNLGGMFLMWSSFRIV